MTRRRLLRSRSKDSRGASLVEFALVVPLFLILVMGIIDFSMTYNDYNSVRQGTAAGARQGVVDTLNGVSCSGTTSQKLACLTKQLVGLDASKTKVKISLPTTYSVGETLRVCTMYQFRSITGMFNSVLNNRIAKAKIDMRIEKLDASPMTNYSETALAGQDWSWC